MRKLLAVLMSLFLVLSFCVCAFATESSELKSPTDEPVFSVEFISYDTDKPSGAVSVVPSGDTIEIAAPISANGDFTGFAIEGEYEIVSGSLNTSPIVIRPLSDIIIIANYSNAGTPTTPSGDNGDNSPQTGDGMMIFIIAVISAAAIVGITLATKKLRSKKGESEQ